MTKPTACSGVPIARRGCIPDLGRFSSSFKNPHRVGSGVSQIISPSRFGVNGRKSGFGQPRRGGKKPAQGNALGTGPPVDRLALKGQNKAVPGFNSTSRGLFCPFRANQGGFAVVPG